MDKSSVLLVQTDTTVGICSSNYGILNKIKGRKKEKKCLLTLPSLNSLKQETRVAKFHKKRVRRGEKTTFIYPKNAYRVVLENSHFKDLLTKTGYLYSTSANLTGSSFQQDWAIAVSDILIENRAGYKEDTPSKIYKLGKRKLKRIR